MIEGHHGSILCLQCLKLGLKEQQTGGEKYKCTLCLRFNIPPAVPHWLHSENPEATACQECMYQAARTFSRNPDVEWKFIPADYPAAVKAPKAPSTPAESPAENAADSADGKAASLDDLDAGG